MSSLIPPGPFFFFEWNVVERIVGPSERSGVIQAFGVLLLGHGGDVLRGTELGYVGLPGAIRCLWYQGWNYESWHCSSNTPEPQHPPQHHPLLS